MLLQESMAFCIQHLENGAMVKENRKTGHACILNEEEEQEIVAYMLNMCEKVTIHIETHSI